MRTYPLDVQELDEFEGGHLGWWSKGWHDKNEFVMEIVTNHDPSIPDLAPLQQRTRHEWWRCVPVGVVGVNRGSLLVKAKPNTRGAFPVTVVE